MLSGCNTKNGLQNGEVDTFERTAHNGQALIAIFCFQRGITA